MAQNSPAKTAVLSRGDVSAFAAIVTAIVVTLSPVLASFGGKVSTDEANPFLWTLASYALLRLVRGGDERWWLVAGGALRIALETKYNGLFYGVALLAALLVLPERRFLASPMALAGIALCVLIALPNALWQWVHGFPMLELLRNGQQGKNIVVSPALFAVQEAVIIGLFFTPVWIAGLWKLAVESAMRFLAVAFAFLMILMVALHGKYYYPAAIYPVPFAAGAVVLETLTSRARLLRPLLAVALVAAGLVFLPFALPVLPEQSYLAYEADLARALPIKRSTVATEHQGQSRLPSDYADMHGWPELAATVGRVVASLPPADRARAVIVAGNYGEAAALDFFGRDLPPVTSGHNQYYLWGTHGASGAVLIDVNGDCGASQHLYRSAERAAVAGTPDAISYELAIPVSVCRGPRFPLGTLWPRLRNYT